MSEQQVTTEKQPKQELQSPASQFRSKAVSLASGFLSDWVGSAKAQEATGRIAVALAASAAAAKKPDDFYNCTPQSVAKVIAISALTGIMPSTGAAALAYAIPRAPRRGEPPQLQYQLSHRGVNALAKRAGMIMNAIPISTRDKLRVLETGEVAIEDRDIDDPPMGLDDLRGVLILVKSVETGALINSGWVPKKLIDARMATSDSWQYAEKPGNEWAKESSPWHEWYVEQAMKTAMHYAIARGWCVIDDTEAVNALRMDSESDANVIDAQVVSTKRVGNLLKTQEPVVKEVAV